MTEIKDKEKAKLWTRRWRWEDGIVKSKPNFRLKHKVKSWSFKKEDLQKIGEQSGLIRYLRLYLIDDGVSTSLIAVGVKVSTENDVFKEDDYLDGLIFKADKICDDNNTKDNCDDLSFLARNREAIISEHEVSFMIDDRIDFEFFKGKEPVSHPVTLIQSELWTRRQREAILDDIQNNRKPVPRNATGGAIKAWTFEIDTITRLLRSWRNDLNKIKFFKFYLAKNEELEGKPSTLIMLVADKENKDIVTGGRYRNSSNHPASASGGPEMFEFAEPCPTLCDDDGELNIDPKEE
ncbi:hypothetical protein BKI52_18580 [marine bacterium AO1-C]|nr:hypothetical protein BKI52_18580 [marine bacterium AO1-C]